MKEKNEGYDRFILLKEKNIGGVILTSASFPFKRIFLIVMDSVGIGEAPDAENLVIKVLIHWDILLKK